MHGGEILLSVCLTVIAVVIGARRARREAEHPPYAGRGRSRAVFAAVALLALVPFLLVTLSHGYGTEGRISAVPFREILDASAHADVDLSDVRAVNLVGNVLLLVPFGAAAAFVWPGRRRVLKTALTGAALSLTVEVAQYALALGRVTSVDDVLLNTSGAALGAVLVRRWNRRARPERPGRPGRLNLPMSSGAGGRTRV
ncbi:MULTISPECIES: VanZ family protein [unclassified Streptomyces]|uniref:VanZ family protein n=1 Tax=unclassified Streptomyces TaxID=2593676 RepID=UPI0006AEB1CD|nr:MULTISPECIES: VanZ family protein [unclassified Streptomyces]